MKKTKLLVLMFSAMLIAGTAIGQQNKANRDGERAKKECTSFISDLSADQEAAIDKIPCPPTPDKMISVFICLLFFYQLACPAA